MVTAKSTPEEIIAEAQRQYASDDVDVLNINVDIVDNGAWVQALVFVTFEEADVDHVYISNTGRVACEHDHGGAYLESELRANPEAKRVTTSLDVWERVPADDATGLTCDGCGKVVG